MGVRSYHPLSNRQQSVRTLSIFLSIERNRSDEICRFCLIRQLGSSLYFGRFLSHGVRSLQALESGIRGPVWDDIVLSELFKMRL